MNSFDLPFQLTEQEMGRVIFKFTARASLLLPGSPAPSNAVRPIALFSRLCGHAESAG
jgi:hypothetical protein